MKITVSYDLNEIDSNVAQFTTNLINLLVDVTFTPNLYYIIAPITLEHCEPLMLCKNTVTKEYKIFKKSTIDAYFLK